ncbi:MAG: phenylalanine--tRNA ligase subunit beta [Calditrichaeota bacterium]|nr:MAG: phenylalanine--tRNA ligase subunit beta [Calditrichota bacterium]
MKISYNWLKEYVELSLSPEKLAEALSLVGLEVEEVIEKRLDIPGIVVGKVLKTEKHPNADKLTLCTVTIGESSELHIICGAPNVAEGQTVPVAMVGSKLPNGMKIRKAKIRGVESEGMICSEEELGLSDHSEGIWVLPDGLELGKPLAQALEFETDYVFDIGVTPNRPDALSHIGVAREVAAIEGKPLQLPEPDFTELKESVENLVQVEILCPEGCPRYAARLIRNVKIGPSPTWMVRRLEAVGLRSINNVVDITNYVLMETGHPLHAFDFKYINGGKIIVRESKEGESFTTLDEKEHTLPEGTVLICDAERPVAIGGIMGGLNSEVTSTTTEVLLESAYFNPEFIRRSNRVLGIHSEAAQRFARGADPNGVLYAQARATQLLVELCEGEVYAGVVDNYPRKIYPVEIELEPERINTLIGVDLSVQKMSELLNKIGLKVQNGKVIVPTFRPDITQTADIAEEVARLYGYDNIPLPENTALPYQAWQNEFDDFIEEIKTILSDAGYQEVITNSMINSQQWEEWTGEKIYPILNPISRDMDGLRNTLIPSLLGVLQWNVNRQMREQLAVFEINTVFHHPGDIHQQPTELIQLGLAITGLREGDGWYSNRQLFDFYDIKGIVEYLADKIFLDNIQFIPYDGFAVEYQALEMKSGTESLGYLGKLKKSLQKKFDLENPVFVAEINLRKVFELVQRERRYREIPRYPRVERDLAIVVDRIVEVQQLLDEIREKGGEYLTSAYVFDIYTGEQIDKTKKSVAFRLFFQSTERTLTENEVNAFTDRILNSLEKKFGARLRS